MAVMVTRGGRVDRKVMTLRLRLLVCISCIRLLNVASQYG